MKRLSVADCLNSLGLVLRLPTNRLDALLSLNSLGLVLRLLTNRLDALLSLRCFGQWNAVFTWRFGGNLRRARRRRQPRLQASERIAVPFLIWLCTILQLVVAGIFTDVVV